MLTLGRLLPIAWRMYIAYMLCQSAVACESCALCRVSKMTWRVFFMMIVDVVSMSRRIVWPKLDHSSSSRSTPGLIRSQTYLRSHRMNHDGIAVGFSPCFTDTWIEFLGNLAQYSMCASNTELHCRNIWSTVDKPWWPAFPHPRTLICAKRRILVQLA